jgi:hypothetical protein
MNRYPRRFSVWPQSLRYRTSPRTSHSGRHRYPAHGATWHDPGCRPAGCSCVSGGAAQCCPASWCAAVTPGQDTVVCGQRPDAAVVSPGGRPAGRGSRPAGGGPGSAWRRWPPVAAQSGRGAGPPRNSSRPAPAATLVTSAGGRRPGPKMRQEPHGGLRGASTGGRPLNPQDSWRRPGRKQGIGSGRPTRPACPACARPTASRSCSLAYSPLRARPASSSPPPR